MAHLTVEHATQRPVEPPVVGYTPELTPVEYTALRAVLMGIAKTMGWSSGKTAVFKNGRVLGQMQVFEPAPHSKRALLEITAAVESGS